MALLRSTLVLAALTQARVAAVGGATRPFFASWFAQEPIMLGPLPINFGPGLDEGKVFGANTQPVYLASNGKRTVVALGGFRGEPGDSVTLDLFYPKGKLVKEGALVPRLWRSETGGQVWTSVDLPPGILRPGATVTFVTTPSGKELLCVIGGLRYCSNAANLRAAYLTTQEVQCTPDLGTMWTDYPGLRDGIGGLAFAAPVQGPFGVWLVGGVKTNKCVKVIPRCKTTVQGQPLIPLDNSTGDGGGNPIPSCLPRLRALELEEGSSNLVPWGGIVAAVFDGAGSSIVDWIVVAENVTALGANRMFPAVTYSSYQQSLYITGGMRATEAALLGSEGEIGDGGDGSDGSGGDGSGAPSPAAPTGPPTRPPVIGSSVSWPSASPQSSFSPEASSRETPRASSTVSESHNHGMPGASRHSMPSGLPLPLRRGRALHLADVASHTGAEENTDLIALRFPARALEAPALSERWARHRYAARVPDNYQVLPRIPDLLEFGMEPGALLLEVLSVRGVGFLPLNMSAYPPVPDNAIDAAGNPLPRFQEDLPVLVLVVNGKVYSSASFGLSGWVKHAPYVYPRPNPHGDSQIMIRAPVVLQARPQMEHAREAFFFAGVSMGSIESDQPTASTAGLFAYGYPNVRCLSPCLAGAGQWSSGCTVEPDDAVCQQCDATAPHETGGSCKEGFTYWTRPCGVVNGSFGWPIEAECMPCKSCAEYQRPVSPCAGPNNTECAFVPEIERLSTRSPTAITPPLVVSSRLNDSSLMPIVALGLISWMVALMALTLRLLGSRSVRGALQGLGAGTVLCREGIILPAAPGKGAQDLFHTLASAVLFLFGLVLQATAGFYLMEGATEMEELWPVASGASRSLGGALLGLLVVGCVSHSAVMIVVYGRGSLVKYGLLARPTQEGCAAASDVAVLTMHPRTALLCVLKLTRGSPDSSRKVPGTGASPMVHGKHVRDPAGAWKVLSYAVSWCRWHQILIDLPSLIASIMCVAGVRAHYGVSVPVSHLLLFLGLSLHHAATLLYTAHVLTLANTRRLVLKMSGAGGLVHDLVASGGVVGHVEKGQGRARLGESSGSQKEGEGATTTTTTPLTVVDVHQRAGRAIKLSQSTTTVHSSMLGATLTGESVTSPLAHGQASQGAASKRGGQFDVIGPARGSIPTPTGASSLAVLAMPADVQMSLYAGAGTVEGAALVTSPRDAGHIMSTQRSSVTAGPPVTVNAHLHMEAYDQQWNDSASATAMVDEHHPRSGAAAYPGSAQSHTAGVWDAQVAIGDAGSAVSAAGGRASSSSSDEMEGSTTAVLGGVTRLLMGGKGSLMVFTSSQPAQQTAQLMAPPPQQQRLAQMSAIGPSSMSSFLLPPPADGAGARELERRPGSVPVPSISSSLPSDLNGQGDLGMLGTANAQAPRPALPPLPIPFSGTGRQM